MSADYPNRADWLNIRRKVRTKDTRKLVHQSAYFGVTKDAHGIARVTKKASTFNEGRNDKRAASKHLQTERIHTLAQRRARQRSGE